MARITVIVPVRDAAATLDRALDSIRDQTFRDWEMVAVDDGSRDASGEILERRAAGDPRIRVHRFDRPRGVVAAHRFGCDQARGEFIARMDADDRSHPGRFEAQLGRFGGDPDLAAVACGVRLLDPLGRGMVRYVRWVNRLLTPEQIAAGRFIEAPVIHPSSMIRRAAIEAVGGYRDRGWPEDYDLWLRLLGRGCRIAKLPEVLFDWQDGPGRLTRSHEHYAAAAVWRMKVHHLARLPGVRGRGVAVCGGGPIARRVIDLLRAERIDVRLVFDVDPCRIGGRLRGVPVLGPADFGVAARDAVLLSAVGVAGGRERVRRLALGAGYREGDDFWCLC